jgi:DNA-binding LytR/AlgR family response regulator
MNTSPFYRFNGIKNPLFVWPDVVRMDGDRNYTVFVLASGKKHISSKTLCFYEPYLPEGLIRIHKNCVINQKHIRLLSVRTQSIILTDNIEVKVARRRWKEICSLLKTCL